MKIGMKVCIVYLIKSYILLQNIWLDKVNNTLQEDLEYTARGFGISHSEKFDCMTFFWSLRVQKQNWIIKIKEINFHFPQYQRPQDIYFCSTIIKTMA